jgi:hypothetical protein
MIRYIEKCTGANHNGPAWIGHVKKSKSGRTLYFNGKAFKRSQRAGSAGNHYDASTGERYWISGVKQDGRDRHWAGSGQIMIEAGVVEEYLEIIGTDQLDLTKFQVVEVVPTDVARFHEKENLPVHK